MLPAAGPYVPPTHPIACRAWHARTGEAGHCRMVERTGILEPIAHTPLYPISVGPRRRARLVCGVAAPRLSCKAPTVGSAAPLARDSFSGLPGRRARPARPLLSSPRRQTLRGPRGDPASRRKGAHCAGRGPCLSPDGGVSRPGTAGWLRPLNPDRGAAGTAPAGRNRGDGRAHRMNRTVKHALTRTAVHTVSG